jgi:5-hydroxyisourate hydrolase
MSSLSTHVLDLSTGRPAAGIAVAVDILSGSEWRALGTSTTDQDGRVKDLLGARPLSVETYRLTFETASYFSRRGVRCFYPHVIVTFSVDDASRSHHVPLLLSPFGYSTYRGS